MDDVVDKFRRIVGLVFKWIFLTIIILVALTALIAAAVYSYNWYTYSRHAAKIEISISTEKKDCDDDRFPIQVLVGNASGKVLERVDFRLAARVKGRSTNIARYHNYTDDHIIQPKKGYSLCWAVPPLEESVSDPRRLEWSIADKTFRFQD